MTSALRKKSPKIARRRGYTMIEMVVVISIIGLMSVVAVPKYRKALERVRASQAFYYLSHFQAAQERYYAYSGEYARHFDQLDGLLNLPVDFEITSFNSTTWQRNWRMVLKRKGSSHGYGFYRLVWTQDGFESYSSNIPNQIMPHGLTRENLQRAKEHNDSFR
ncbi:MAG: prepilin-type N-terminal cleavage/methylation domain-containing protein [Planctomycetes bacterium]|nr:prepilin-type N-terminal cleavage/methylation domain-containing protein [Planctomycetota bacterium]